jgi:integrase/recombinase XerD
MIVVSDFDFIQRDMTFADEEMVRFLQSESGKTNSDETIYKYAKGLEDYSDWLDENDRGPLREVDYVDLQNYLAYLTKRKGYADKTVYIKWLPVQMFYSHLSKLKQIDSSPADDVDVTDYIESTKSTKTEKETGEERIYLKKDEVEKLVNNAPAPQLRNRLAILFMYYTALRRSEVTEVRVGSLNRDDRTVNVRVKGGDTHTAKWHSDLDGLMAQWLDYGYRDSYPTAEDSPYLFVTNTTEQLSPARLGEIVNEAAENAGLQETIFTDTEGRERNRITSHKLRHSFAMNALNDGMSIETLSNRLAHSSVVITEIYAEMEDDQSIEEYDEVVQPVNSDSSTEAYQCLLCGQKGNLQEHHISNKPEKTIDVCSQCHQDIHRTDQYNHLLDAECEL